MAHQVRTGAGHKWTGSKPVTQENEEELREKYDVAEAIWRFFKRYSR